MAPPRVGVELAAPGADPGGWLAEATAYEAAGVDSLWVGTEPGANPWVLLGALAAVTWRVRLGAVVDEGARAEETVAVATLRRLSRERLLLGRPRRGSAMLDVEGPVAAGAVDVGDAGRWAGLEAAVAGGEVERWARAAPPPGRRAWAEALAAAADADAHGLLVPATPGLLDLLRNPDDEDDRGDLRLTYG